MKVHCLPSEILTHFVKDRKALLRYVVQLNESAGFIIQNSSHNSPNLINTFKCKTFDSILKYRFKRVGKITQSDYYLRHVRLPVWPSACNKSAPDRRIFIKCYICVVFRKSVEKSHVILKFDKITGTFLVRPKYIYDNISFIYS